MSDNISLFPPTGMQRIKQYLIDRGFNPSPEFLNNNELELCGPARITELLGYSIGPEAIGLAIHFPGTDYFQLRPIGHKKYKILCPAGRTPEAYLPTCINWQNISGRLIICESALKALTWAEFGHAAMAAGGVATVYMARKRQWCDGFPHGALESGAITEILISFDSDIDSNHDVARSLRQLTGALQNLYPKIPVFIKRLPLPSILGLDMNNDSWGVDDFRAHVGDEEFSEWCEEGDITLSEPQQDEMNRHFDELDAQYIYCRQPVQVIEIATGEEYSVSDFSKYHEGGRTIFVEDRPVQVAPRWLARPRDERPEVRQKAYHPGGGVLVGGDYNDWRPSTLVPQEGDVSPWLNLLEESIPDTEVRELLIQCMAFQVQHRGVRLPKIIYFTGYKQGTGKSTQAEIMRRILGHSNTGWITRHEIESNFNADWAVKELVVLDDVPKLSKDLWPRIKNHVTSPVVTVQRKFREGRQQNNYAVLYVSSNTNDVLPLEEDERRVLMVEFDPKHLHRGTEDRYWADFHSWLDEGDGCEAIAYYLQNVVNLENFDPNFHPPNNEVKQSAASQALSDEATWLQDFVENWREFNIPKERLYIGTEEMFILYAGEPKNSTNKRQYNAFSRTVTKTRMFHNPRGQGKQVTLSDRTRVTAWLLPGLGMPAEDPGSTAVRDNMEKYPIKLQSGLQKY